MSSHADEWPGIKISDWRSFVSHATDYMEGGSFVFRGQADSSWSLRPSLLRYPLSGASTETILELEKQAEDEFRAQAHLHLGPEHLPGRRETPLQWWALMQRYGAPTRLLDWTLSPFVAAYFAVEQSPGKEGVVFVVDADAVRAGFKAHYEKQSRDPLDWHQDLRSVNAPDGLLMWSQPLRRSARSVAQQGLFSASVNIGGNHEKLSQICRDYRRCASNLEPVRRWLFPPAVKDEILKYLRTTNIAAHSLFPGLDGLGRSIGEIARIGRSGVTQSLSMPTISSTRLFAPEIGGASQTLPIEGKSVEKA